MLSYSALFVVYYPPLSGIEDEVGFVNQTLVWSRGAISSEGAGLHDLADFALIGERHLARRHPGRSLLALPFLMVGGLRAIFVSGLLVHLAMTGSGAAHAGSVRQVTTLGCAFAVPPDSGDLQPDHHGR